MRWRRWELWSLRPRVVVYVLLIEGVTAAMLIRAVTDGPVPQHRDWMRLGVLAGAALAHVHWSRRAEERRRSDGTRRHVDVMSIWTFPAAVALPIPLVAVLIALVRVQRHRIARKPSHKAILSAASITLAAVSAHSIATAGLDLWPHQRLDDAVLVVLAAAVFCGQQVVLVGAAIILEADQRPPFTAVFGGAQQWREVYLAISLGIAVALAGTHPVLVVLMVGVGLALNRLIAAQADAEHKAREADRAVTHARRAARIDALTNVLNKQGWRDEATERLHAMLAGARGFAVVVVDLDWFKRVNDTFGHLAGDELLQAVAQVLTDGVRDGDLVGRFGGEELLVALPDADTAEAHRIAERLLTGIRAIRIPTTRLRGGAPAIITCTASIGVAASTSITDLDMLLALADQAMYEAKNSGRDRVVIAGISRPMQDSQQRPT